MDVIASLKPSAFIRKHFLIKASTIYKNNILSPNYLYLGIYSKKESTYSPFAVKEVSDDCKQQAALLIKVYIEKLRLLNVNPKGMNFSLTIPPSINVGE